MAINLDKKKLNDLKEKAQTLANDAGRKTLETTSSIVDKGSKLVKKTTNDVYNAMDANGDGQIGIDDVILLAFKTPGISINRREFLTKEFSEKYTPEIVLKAINETPLKAGISQEDINKIADDVIVFERNCVSGISAALGMPGGMAMAATIPADIAQYYGYMLRTAQKLLYLYGFPQIDTSNSESNLSTETMNTLILCLGVMYGVANANNAIKAMAKALAIGVEKKLINAALTKGTVYPIVKSVAKWFGVNMTKKVFAGFFQKSIPVIGGVVGGGITFVTFKPCCDRLKATLENTMLSNPNNYKEDQEIIDIEITEAQEI